MPRIVKKKKIVHSSCTQLRRKLIRHGTLDMKTGKSEMTGKSEWVTEPCGIPLFSDPDAQEKGICKSCRTGWTHPHNYPVES